MAVVSFISQKGGVGKSTLSRAFAREAVNSGLSVKLADLDTQQTSSVDWQRLRLAQGVSPEIPVQAFATAAGALKEAKTFDYLVVDAPARASKGTLELARVSALVVQPTGASLDDLRPAVRVFHELKAAGIPTERLVFALCRIGTDAEEADARDYLARAGFEVLAGSLPEKAGYRLAQNTGRSVTEATHATLRRRADTLIEDMVRRLEGGV